MRAFLDTDDEPVVATTDESGAFAFERDELAPGSYSVEFVDETGSLTTEWWQDAATRELAEPVVVDAEASAYLVASIAAAAGESVEEPAAEEPAVEEPAVEEPATDESDAEAPGAEAPIDEQPAAEEEPAVEDPAAEEEPAVEEPAAEEEPAVEEPAAEEPAAEEPAAEKPATDEEQPGGKTPEFVQSPVKPAAKPSQTPFAIAATAKISGTVRDPAGVPLAWIGVTAYLQAEGSDYPNWVEFTATNEQGKYTFEGLAAGSYTLSFSGVEGYAPEWWNNAPSRDNAVYFALAAGASTTKDAALAKGATVSGFVKNGSGVGIANVSVYATQKSGDGSGYASTNSDGWYKIIGLAAGSYTLEFRSSEYAPEWWDNAASIDKASYFTLAAGASTRKDAALAKASTITGTVTDASGIGIADVSVTASANDYRVSRSASTDASGKYTITGLGAGSYTLEFSSSKYAQEWWDNASVRDQASYFTLAAGASVTKDAALANGAMITGTVRNTDGVALKGVFVSASSKPSGQSGYATTDGSGKYTITGLRAGSYTLEFSRSGLATKWWANASTSEKASYFDLAWGAITTKDAYLAAGSTIVGSVKNSAGVGIFGVSVNASMRNGGWVGYATTDSAGKYKITGLAAGSYTLEFVGGGYIGKFWGNATSIDKATYFTLAAGASTTKNAGLLKGSTISGTVKNYAGSGVAGALVTAIKKGSMWSNSGWTDDSGKYTISGLAAGSYTLKFSGSDYLNEWWSNADSQEKASYFSLAAGASITKDAALAKGAKISGTVKNYAGVGIAGVYVSANQENSAWSGSATTDFAGQYTITGLAAGRYTLSFTATNHVSEWWSNAPSREKASYFTLATAASTTKDAALATGAKISGTVRNSAGNVLSGAYVMAYRKGGGAGASAITDAWGKYSLTGLAAGSYTLQFGAPWGSADASEWWQNANSRDNAHYFSLAGAASTTKNAMLPKGATITGTVKNTAGAAIAGVSVSAESKSGGWGNATSDASGKYKIEGLAVGSYTLYFNANGYVHQRWDNKLSYEQGTFFSVPAAGAKSKNAVLVKGASISGVVKDSSGKAVEGAYVFAHLRASNGETQRMSGGRADAAGKYTITDLPAGKYTLESNATGYAMEWFSSADTLSKATYFTVAVGGVAGGKNFSMDAGGAITGSVTGKLGSTIAPAKVKVEVFNAAGALVTTVSTYSDEGTYRITGLRSGTYRLKFISIDFKPGTRDVFAGPYKTEYWNNASSLATAGAIAVVAGKDKVADVQLAQKPWLKATTPKVSGTAAAGKTLTASVGTWTVGTKFNYQWLADGRSISGATKPTFVVTAAQKGAAISVKVTGWKTDYLTVSKVSAATAKVAG